MSQDIKEYVARCQLCARNKSKTHKLYGNLSPLPVPEDKWTIVAMDFITDLPKTKKGDTATRWDVSWHATLIDFPPKKQFSKK